MRDIKMDSLENLVIKLMRFNKYPNHEIYWEGWEYVPETKEEISKFLTACEYPFYDYDVAEFCCLQCDPNFTKFTLVVDGFVENISKKQFTNIIKKMQD